MAITIRCAGIQSNRLEILLDDIVTERIPLHIIFPRGNFALSKVRAFVDFVRSEMQDSSATGQDAAQSLASAI